MAEFKLSRLKYTWRGAWSSSERYNPDDVVSFGSKVYVCLVSHTANIDFYSDLNAQNGDIPPLSVPRWELMADGVRWQGDWEASTPYIIGDIVKIQGNLYVCAVPHVSETDITLIDLSNWILQVSSDKWFNTWQIDTYYKVNDIVRYGGIVYRCILPHQSAGDTDTGLEGNISAWEIVSISDDWKGNWSINTRYRQNDIVKYGGSVYRCLDDHTSDQDAVNGLIIDIDKWQILHAGVEYKSDWQASTLYLPNDVVKYGSYLYKSLELHESGFGFVSAVWEIFIPGLEYDRTWDEATAYQQGDIVKYGGQLYTAVVDVVTLQPDTNPLSWRLLFDSTRMRGDWSLSAEYQPGDVVRRGGNSYYSLTTNTGQDPDLLNDGSTTNSDHWRFINTSISWRGVWTEGETYSAGDTVVWVSSSYRCRDKHVADQNNRPDDDPLIGMSSEEGAGDSTLLGTYWEKVTEGFVLNRMQLVGDLRTFGPTGDGSTIGYTRIPPGNTGQTLVVGSNGTAEWTNLNSSAKVYYVALDGEDVPSAGTSPNNPWRTIRYACENITGVSTIYVRTGVFEEILPIRLPAFVAIVGDELRSTVVKPAPTQLSETYIEWLSDAVLYLDTILEFVVQGLAVGNEDEAPETVIYGEIEQDFSAGNGSPTEVGAISILTATFNARMVNGTVATINGTNAETGEVSRLAARSQIINNKDFLINEATLRLTNTVSGFVESSRWQSDLSKIIDALIYDLFYVGNWQTYEVATYYLMASNGDLNKTQNMFLLRDGTGLRNMTLVGLEGTLGEANIYGTRRPSAGAYASLDPGWGVSDSSAWVGTKSPYVQNVTTFGTGCIGLKVDGDIHAGGNQTVVANDFTQILSDGIGVWCNSTGKSECVSVFTYYNHIGYLCTIGGKIRGTNGNCSYGTFGAVSESSNVSEVPITASVNNRYYEASVNQVVSDTDRGLMKFFFSNAGVNYTQAAFSITGSGINAQVEADEFRDGGVFELRISDPGDSTAAGGSGYVFQTNAAQGGNEVQVQLAGSDENEPDVYRGMRLYIGSGVGVGQYGYIADYDDTGKYAYVAKEKYPEVIVTETTSAGNTLTASTTENLNVDDAIIFSGTKFGNIQDLTIYYVKTIESSTTFTISATEGGATYNLINETGTMYYHILGFEHIVPGTPIESTLDGTTNYFIEPRLTFSSPGFTTAAVALPASRQWTSIDASEDRLVAVALDYNLAGVSSDGLTWTTTPLTTTDFWIKVRYVGGVWMAFATSGRAARSEDGLAWVEMTMPSVREWRDVAYGNGIWVAVSNGGTAAAKSTDGETWSSVTLPEGADWNSVVYGKGIFVASSLSDSTATSTIYSSDGETWTLGNGFAGGSISLTYGQNKFVAISGGYSSAQESFISFDGINWIAGTLPNQATWKKVKYAQGVFIAVAEGESTCAVSHDGLTWTSESLGSSAPWTDITFTNISKPGKFIAIAGNISNSSLARSISTGVTAQARAVVVSGRISEFRIWEQGSGYTSAPALVLTDPSNSSDVSVDVRIGNGVLSSPSIINKGVGYATTSTRVAITGNGYRDQYQIGTDLVVDNLTRIPGPGDNVTISGIDDYTYKLLTATVLSGTAPNITARLSIAKDLGRDEAPEHDTVVEIRQQYSQVRLTGHDFLDIGLGNFIQTNYPDVLNPVGTVVSPENEVLERDGGRVFYTSTDQDGNFRVGELFAVEQATGTVTLNAQFFELQGLEELRLGGVTVGGTGVVVREFSTDTLFTADSNNVVPTQKAIKAFLTRRVSGGGADAVTGSLIAGVVQVGPDQLTTTTLQELIFETQVNFKGGIDGDWLVQSYFLGSN